MSVSYVLCVRVAAPEPVAKTPQREEMFIKGWICCSRKKEPGHFLLFNLDLTTIKTVPQLGKMLKSGYILEILSFQHGS